VESIRFCIICFLFISFSCNESNIIPEKEIINSFLGEMRCSELNSFVSIDNCFTSLANSLNGEPISPEKLELEDFDYEHFYKNSKVIHFENEINEIKNAQIQFLYYPIDSIQNNGSGDIFKNFHFHLKKKYENYFNGLILSNPRYLKEGYKEKYLFQLNGFYEYKTQPFFYLVERNLVKEEINSKRLTTKLPKPPKK